MPFLMTHSLLNAYSYMHSCREECAEDAYADFIRTLRREPHETTPEMQNGIDFENAVYRLARGESFDQSLEKWRKGIEAVATRIKGAQTQVRISRPAMVNGIELLVYGILDALKAGEMDDVKFVNKSFGSVDLAGKYFDSTQHPTYFYLCPESHVFNYLVSDGNDLYTETYTPQTTRRFEVIASEFLTSLDMMGLMPLYMERWQAR